MLLGFLSVALFKCWNEVSSVSVPPSMTTAAGLKKKKRHPEKIDEPTINANQFSNSFCPAFSSFSPIVSIDSEEESSLDQIKKK